MGKNDNPLLTAFCTISLMIIAIVTLMPYAFAAGTTLDTAEKISIPGTYSGTVVEDQNIIYKISIPSGKGLVIDFIFSDMEGDSPDATVELRSLNGDYIDDQGFDLHPDLNPTQKESVSWVFENAQEGYIVLSGSSGYKYQLSVRLEDYSDASSGKDAPESFDEALPISIKDYPVNYVSYHEDDMFKLDVAAGQIIKMQIVPDGECYMEFDVYGLDRARLGGGLGSDKGKILTGTFPNFKDKTIYLGVTSSQLYGDICKYEIKLSATQFNPNDAKQASIIIMEAMKNNDYIEDTEIPEDIQMQIFVEMSKYVQQVYGDIDTGAETTTTQVRDTGYIPPTTMRYTPTTYTYPYENTAAPYASTAAMVFLLVMAGIFILLIVSLICWIIALISIFNSNNDSNWKLIWFLIVTFLGLIGCIVYFLVGKKSRISVQSNQPEPKVMSAYTEKPSSPPNRGPPPLLK